MDDFQPRDTVISASRLDDYQQRLKKKDAFVEKATQKLNYWGNVSLSYSAFSNYKQCPLKGVLASTRVVPLAEQQPTRPANFRGQVVHMVFDMVLERSRREPQVLLSPDAFIEAIPLAWGQVEKQCAAGVSWSGDSEKDKVLQELKDNITSAYGLIREAPDGTRVLRMVYEHEFATESRFKVPITRKVSLNGKIDLRVVAPDLLLVVDYKDGKKEYTDWRQLAFYMAEHLEKGLPCRGGFLYTSLGEWGWKDITTKKWEQLKEEIQEIVSLIESRDFPAKHGRLCSWCDFCDFCPEYAIKEGFQKVQMDELASIPDGPMAW